MGNVIGAISGFIGLDKVFDYVLGWLTPDQEYQGGTEVKFGNPSFEPVVYGQLTRVEGVVVKSKIADPNDGDDVPNDLIYLQVIWSVGKIEEITQIYLDDKPIDSTYFDDGSKRWVYHHDYIDGEDVVFSLGGVEHFKSESKGYSYSVIRLEYHSEKMNHIPRITADLKGIKVTPVGGGAKVYSTNYSDILDDYLTNTVYGRGLPASRLNQARLIAEEAFTSSLVYPYANSPSYQPLMSCNIRLDGNSTLLTNVNKILKGCRGFLPYIDGQFHFYIERERTALAAFEITDKNRMSDFTVDDNEVKDHFNKVTVRFKDRSQEGKLVNAEYPTDSTEYATYLSEDNGVHYDKTITIETINNMYEALQAAEIVLKRSRNALKVKVSSKSEGKIASVGMVINVSNEAFGMVQKPFIIVNRKTKANGIIDWELLEYQGSIYPWNTKPEQIIPDSTVGDYTIAEIPTNLAVVFPTDGTSQALFTWDSPHNSFIVKVDEDNFTTLTGNKFHALNNITVGTRTFSVQAINGLGYRSLKASLSFEITDPIAPVLSFTVGESSIEVALTIDGSYLGVTFELMIGTTNVFDDATSKGQGGNFTFIGLLSDTTYYFWARTINVAGKSAWSAVKSAKTLVASVDVQNISMDQLDENLASIIRATDRGVVELQADMTDEQIRTLFALDQAVDAEINLQVVTAKGEASESNIINLTIVTDQQATQINQVSNTANGAYSYAANYTNTAAGYWNGSLWIEGPISENIRTMRVTLDDGSYSKITNIAQAFRDVDGNLVAHGGMLTDVNNRIGGFMTYNDGELSQFDVIASTFRVGDYVGGNPNNAFESYLYANQGVMILENSWIRAAAAVIGVGVTSYLNGNPVLVGYDRANIGNVSGSTVIVGVSNANNIQGAIMYSWGQCMVIRHSLSPAFLVQKSGSEYSGGTSIRTEANTGQAEFEDGVAPFTGKHSYLIPYGLTIGILMEQGDLHARMDINNALFYADVCNTPRSRLAIGSLAQQQELGEYTPEEISDIDGSITPSKLRTLNGLTQQQFSDLYATHVAGYINALGEGLMLVCAESGNIETGQWLCSSSMEGHAMLQTDEVTGDYEKYFTDYTVAKSSESVNWSNEPSDSKLIAVYYKGG